jgi:tight adherence protein B
MGAIVGLFIGLGIVLIVAAFTAEPPTAKSKQRNRLTRLVERAAIPRVTTNSLVGACVASALVTGTAVLVITAVPMAALLAMIISGYVPIMLLKRRVNQRMKALRTSWPDAVDALVSAVRAGMSLPEALIDLAHRGPEPLRPSFTLFTQEYRATGSFEHSLQALQDVCADTVADRVVASLRIAREVGGTDLGSVLRTLSTLLREDARTRGEIEARQSWTVAAARMAVAAPWVTLALLSTRPEGMAAYQSALGALVLLIAAGASVLAYRMMMAIGRLPIEPRLIT